MSQSAPTPRKRKTPEQQWAELQRDIAVGRPLTVRQVALVLGRREKFVVQAIQTRKLPFVPHGKWYRIRPADLELFLKRQADESILRPDPRLSHKKGARPAKPPLRLSDDPGVMALFG